MTNLKIKPSEKRSEIPKGYTDYWCGRRGQQRRPVGGWADVWARPEGVSVPPVSTDGGEILARCV